MPGSTSGLGICALFNLDLDAMRQEMRQEYRARPIAALVALVVGAVGVGWLFPGGIGDEQPVHVTGGASASVYRSVNEAVVGGPGWLATVFELATEGTLVILGLLLVWVWWTAFRAQDARRTAGAVLVGVGTVVAYALSEGLKLVADEERPCRVLKGVDAIVDCPGPADWSFPSNHSTLAMGLAMGLVLVRPRLAAVALPLGVAGGVLRVLVGAHYPHDVIAGLLLGATVCAAVVLLFGPLAARAVARLWPGRRRRGDAPPAPAPTPGEENHTLALNVNAPQGTPPSAAARPGPGTAPGQAPGPGQAPAPGQAPGPGPAGYDPGFVGHDGSGSPVVHPQPGQDRTDMGFDRSFHHQQAPRDLSVGQPGAQEGQHFPLPGGEPVDPRTSGGTPPGHGPHPGGGEVRDDPGGHFR